MLRRAQFQKLYSKGFRASGPLFSAVCLKQPGEPGPKIGFAVPRAVGKSVARNRMRRRLREAIRLRLKQLAPQWWVVFNPRRTVLDADFGAIEREVERLFSRCSGR